MKTALIFLVGNRDVQIPASFRDDLKGKYLSHLDHNNDGTSDNLIIKKSRDAQPFLETSRIFYEDRVVLKPYLTFPMLDQTLRQMSERPNIIFITASKQQPLHSQDTTYFAQLIKWYLKTEGYESELRPFHHNPNDLPGMVEFYTALYDEIDQQFEHTVVSNSGGTPTMRSASHFAGLFRGFDYITINAADAVNLRPFATQEKLILLQIVEQMLAVFNYEGVNQLPTISEDVKALASYAKARSALNFKLAKKHLEPYLDNALFRKLHDTVEDRRSLRGKEREMYLSAKIKFRQQNYADYLWRLFTIQENMYRPILEKYFGESIEFDKSNQHQKWNALLANHPELLTYLQNKKLGSRPLYYEEPSKTVLDTVYYYLTTKSKQLPIDNNAGTIKKGLDQLSDLRNAIAHNYGTILPKGNAPGVEGIGIDEIKSKLPKKISLDQFNDSLSKFIGLAWDDFDDYQKINDYILLSLRE